MGTVVLALLSGALGSLLTFAIQATLERMRLKAEAGLNVVSWIDDLYTNLMRMKSLKSAFHRGTLKPGQQEMYTELSTAMLSQTLSAREQFRVATLWGFGRELDLLAGIQGNCLEASRLIRQTKQGQADWEMHFERADRLMESADRLRFELSRLLVKSASVPELMKRLMGEALDESKLRSHG